MPTEQGVVNFPYLKFKGVKEPVISTQRSLSFCCTFFSPAFLQAYDFKGLDEAPDWYDTFISKKSVELDFKNTILMHAPVWHRPHLVAIGTPLGRQQSLHFGLW
jgi:hypothetical protein